MNKEKLKEIMKLYVNAQKSYKTAIKNYIHYQNKYVGCKIKDVPTELRDIVFKCRLPISRLAKKSNEVRIILDWFNRGETALIGVTNKDVLKYIRNIKDDCKETVTSTSEGATTEAVKIPTSDGSK